MNLVSFLFTVLDGRKTRICAITKTRTDSSAPHIKSNGKLHAAVVSCSDTTAAHARIEQKDGKI